MIVFGLFGNASTTLPLQKVDPGLLKRWLLVERGGDAGAVDLQAKEAEGAGAPFDPVTIVTGKSSAAAATASACPARAARIGTMRVSQ